MTDVRRRATPLQKTIFGLFAFMVVAAFLMLTSPPVSATNDDVRVATSHLK